MLGPVNGRGLLHVVCCRIVCAVQIREQLLAVACIKNSSCETGRVKWLPIVPRAKMMHIDSHVKVVRNHSSRHIHFLLSSTPPFQFPNRLQRAVQHPMQITGDEAPCHFPSAPCFGDEACRNEANYHQRPEPNWLIEDDGNQQKCCNQTADGGQKINIQVQGIRKDWRSYK